MHKAQSPQVPQATEIGSLSSAELARIVRSQAQTIEALQHRLAWFERQVFGSKSERLSVLENPQQLALAQLWSGEKKTAPAQVRTVAAHTRRASESDVGEAESVPFFDETRVPVETITVPNPHARGLAPDQYEVCFAASSDTEVGMMTSSPGFQLTGVATFSRAVSCSESSTRTISSKLRPVLIG